MSPFRVYIGNGDCLPCKFCCPQVSLQMQGHCFPIDLHLLPIEGPEVVLGIQWLQQLGGMYHDYAAMSMEFSWNGKRIILNGDTKTTPKLITLHQFQALITHKEIQSLYELHCLPHNSHSTTELSKSIKFPINILTLFVQLLKRFILFQPPMTLPPHRLIDHKIHLVPNTKPVNVRPYRYPYFHKCAIINIVKEMREQGIIRPSQSSFSSPVLLVKKKDGSYRYFLLNTELTM